MHEPSDPTLSVVVPFGNEERNVGAQLAALSTQEFDATWELILVENESTEVSRNGIDRFASDLPRRLVDGLHNILSNSEPSLLVLDSGSSCQLHEDESATASTSDQSPVFYTLS
jgi:glycosyltransferase involved in cell wall biosynthesis